MNDRRPKLEDDDNGGMDFELRTHRIERRKKMCLNSQSSLEQARTNKENNHEQLHGALTNRNPYNSAIYEPTCKLHPNGSYSSQYSSVSPSPNPFSHVNKFNNHHRYEMEARYPSFCNEMYYTKCTTLSPPPPSSLSIPSVPTYTQQQQQQPQSPRVYFQKQASPFGHSHHSPLPSSPIITTNTTSASIQQQQAPISNSEFLSNITPRIVRPTPQGTVPPTDVNRNPPVQQLKVTEIYVILKNQVLICLEVANAETITSKDLIALILEEPEIGLTSEDEDAFALWLISPLFDVQLKHEHRPYQVSRKWPELLAKYTTATPAQRERDSPCLSLQRDVFYSKRDEMRLSNHVALELLYEEAKRNFLAGRYPYDPVEAEKLAAIQARIELGKFDPDIHSLSFFKSRLDTFLPSYVYKSRRSFFNFGSKSGLEYKLLLQFRSIEDDVPKKTLMRQYMEHCWNLPFYGSAFFPGQLENPAHGLAVLFGYNDIPVLVGINSEGVTIINQAEGEILLGLRYQELSWDSARPAQENNSDCLPCLFLQFQVSEGGQRVFKVLQVFSKQAILMDAIISSFVRALRRRSWDRDEVDDSSAPTPGDCTPDADDAQTPLTTSSLYGSTTNDTDTCISSKLQRLSLATFNEDGDCIRLMGSWQFK